MSSLLCSCNFKKNQIQNSNHKVSEIQIPLGTVNSDSSTFLFYKKIENVLGLKDLNSNRENTHIRIWNICTDTARVIEIHELNGEWRSKILYFRLNQDSSHNITSIESWSKESIPLSGWNSFLKRIDNYNIYEVKNYSEIPNYELTLGGNHLFLEIVKNQGYRKRLLLSYEANENNENVKNVLLTIFLIQRQFGYDLIGYPNKLK